MFLFLACAEPVRGTNPDDTGAEDTFVPPVREEDACDGFDNNSDGVVDNIPDDPWCIGAHANWVIRGHEAANGGAGSSISVSGDLDLDGLDDLAFNEGESVYVFSARDLAPGETTTAYANWEIVGPSGSRAGGGQLDRGSGVEMIPDLDADGRAELVIGAPGNWDWSYKSPPPGAAYVVLGGALGAERTLNLAETAAVTLTDGAGATTYVGSAVTSAGDVDGDGSSDLLVTSYTTIWLVPASTLELDHSDLDLSRGILIEAVDFDSYSVYPETARSAGDVDGDGLADTLAACQVCGDTDGTYHGETYIFFGASLPAPGGSVSPADADLTIGSADQVRFGEATVAGGDIDGDGLGDWGGSCTYDDENGGIYLFYGSARLAGTSALATDADVHITPEGPDDSGISGFFGPAMSLGDFDGDGRLDLAAIDRYPESVYYVFLNDQLGGGTWSADTAALRYTGLTEDYLDATLYGPLQMDGDLDGDGSSELVMGLPFAPSSADPHGSDGEVVILRGE